MASWTSKETSKILVLENSAVQRSCPQQTLKPVEFARLVVLSTPLRGLELEFKPNKSRSVWILGSGHGADFVISDSTLHATHLYIENSGGDWLVTSHPDCWGFYVNNEPVETAVVEHGDRLRVGRHELVFVGSVPSARQAFVKEVPKRWTRWFKRAS